MRAFKSVCRRQIILVIRAPHMQKVVRGWESRREEGVENSSIVRIKPYPPSFRRMAASIMDPAIGASTCALGNQRWNPYIGIFMVKASKQNNHHREERGRENDEILSSSVMRGRFAVRVVVKMDIMAIRSGSDPIIV